MRQLAAKLLDHFRLYEGKDLSRDGLALAVWGLRLDPRSRCIDQTVSELRKRLGKNERIIAVTGVGYRYDRLKK